MSKQPSPIMRLIAHALVGFAAAALVSREFGPQAGVVGGIAAVIAHEELDVPVARLLTDAGA